jgi:hypothetical protein
MEIMAHEDCPNADMYFGVKKSLFIVASGSRSGSRTSPAARSWRGSRAPPRTAARSGTTANASITIKSAGSTTVNLANFYYDATNEKILCFDETPAQIADTSDLTGVVLRVEAYGH